MYDIKQVISKLKLIANLHSNIELSSILNISYNTLNTWIKREKIPQEVLIEFCKKFNCSLDYLLLDKKNNINLFSENKTEKSNNYYYYGAFNDTIKPGSKLELIKDLYHNNGYYLILLNKVYFIAKVIFDIDNNATIYINNEEKTFSFNDFCTISKGLIKRNI